MCAYTGSSTADTTNCISMRIHLHGCAYMTSGITESTRHCYFHWYVSQLTNKS